MRVKIIKEYNDRRLSRVVKPGEELTVDGSRGRKLIEALIAKEIPEKQDEPVAVPTKRPYVRKTEQASE